MATDPSWQLPGKLKHADHNVSHESRNGGRSQSIHYSHGVREAVLKPDPQPGVGEVAVKEVTAAEAKPLH